jgi:hypothetical protein
MTRFRNSVLFAIGCVALSALAGIFTAGPAVAQLVKAALVMNIDERGRAPWQVTKFVPCGAQATPTDVCLVSLPPAPDGKRLVVQHLSAVLLINKPTLFLPVFVDLVPSTNNSQENNGRRARLVPALVGESPTAPVNLLYVNGSEPVNACFGAGETPQILVWTVGFSGLVGTGRSQVVVSGNLIDCTAGCAPIAS